jgi:hypothetical protein
LKTCGENDSHVDVVISNCVINLSRIEEFQEAWVLKPGGGLVSTSLLKSFRKVKIRNRTWAA